MIKIEFSSRRQRRNRLTMFFHMCGPAALFQDPVLPSEGVIDVFQLTLDHMIRSLSLPAAVVVGTPRSIASAFQAHWLTEQMQRARLR